MRKDVREVLIRGDLVEPAVAAVIGIAFAVAVTSLVDTILMPTAAILRRVSKETAAVPDPSQELLPDSKRLLEEQNTPLRK